jgi:flavin reductase (DIM6/NTAB) family NADH-FMN oxidoreductase RutF
MADYLELDPATTERRQIYRMLVGSVVPRPIGWASTVSASGRTNLAPFSFFTVVCVVPPMISLTIARNPDGSEKHTLKNAKETGEFCFNVVTEPVWKEMVDSANGFPEEESEFDKTGLTPLPSVKIKPPRVKEVPIHFECRLHQVIELGPNRHPLGNRRGGVHARRSGLHDQRLYRHAQAQPDRPPQRLLLFLNRRNIRAQVQRRPAAVALFCGFALSAGFCNVRVMRRRRPSR